MRTIAWTALAAAVLLGGCKVNVKDSGKLPEVDVKDSGGTQQIDIKPGTMPDVDVKTDSSVKLPDVQAPDIKAPHIAAPKLPDLNPGGHHVTTDTAHHR